MATSVATAAARRKAPADGHERDGPPSSDGRTGASGRTHSEQAARKRLGASAQLKRPRGQGPATEAWPRGQGPLQLKCWPSSILALVGQGLRYLSILALVGQGLRYLSILPLPY